MQYKVKQHPLLYDWVELDNAFRLQHLTHAESLKKPIDSIEKLIV